MPKWTRLTEAQIRKAEAEGQFKDLRGAGKPLPEHPEEAHAAGGETVGYRIMAEAGAVPEEFRLKAAMDEALGAVNAAPDETTRKTAMARFADLQLRYEIARDARRRFMR